MMAAPIAVIVGAPVSEALLGCRMRCGLRGWQWLFLVEGLPAVVLGLLALGVLTDRPEQASTGCRRTIARGWRATMAAEQAQRQAVGSTQRRARASRARACGC